MSYSIEGLLENSNKVKTAISSMRRNLTKVSTSSSLMISEEDIAEGFDGGMLSILSAMGVRDIPSLEDLEGPFTRDKAITMVRGSIVNSITNSTNRLKNNLELLEGYRSYVKSDGKLKQTFERIVDTDEIVSKMVATISPDLSDTDEEFIMIRFNKELQWLNIITNGDDKDSYKKLISLIRNGADNINTILNASTELVNVSKSFIDFIKTVDTAVKENTLDDGLGLISFLRLLTGSNTEIVTSNLKTRSEGENDYRGLKDINIHMQEMLAVNVNSGTLVNMTIESDVKINEDLSDNVLTLLKTPLGNISAIESKYELIEENLSTIMFVCDSIKEIIEKLLDSSTNKEHSPALTWVYNTLIEAFINVYVLAGYLHTETLSSIFAIHDYNLINSNMLSKVIGK